MNALSPESVAERARAIRDYDMLDAPREKDFDDIAVLASEICGMPVALVTLLDAERQWSVAEVGAGFREMPATDSFCQHAVASTDVVEIPDLRADPRTRDNPLVTGEPHVRSYAGMPLLTEEGISLGTLCVLDFEPRVLTQLQRDTLRVLARQVMAQLDLRRQLRIADTLRSEVDHRVKNSLATVGAYTRLKARRFPAGDPTRAALSEVEQRITAASMVHEALSRAGGDGPVDLDAYLGRFVAHLGRGAPAGVTVEPDLPGHRVAVASRVAGSVGALVNEAVSNAFKHAFGPKGGRVRVALRPAADGGWRLAIEDDGHGMARESRDGGLGMAVIEATAAELGGEAAIETGPDGSSVSVAIAAD